MSIKKKITKASRRYLKLVAVYVAKWGRKPDASDKRFLDRTGRWPSKAEMLFWDRNRRFPKPGELARITKAANAKKKMRRSLGAKRGWQKRKQKPDEVRAWERDRKALQAAQIDALKRAEVIGIRRPLKAHRWFDFFYISLSQMSIDEIYGLLLALKRRGVKAFRIEREVPVGEYTPNDFASPSGFLSTKFQFMDRLSETALRYGNAKTGLPALEAMRAPGLDVMRYLIVDDSSVRDHFPRDLTKVLLNQKRETNKTIRDLDAQAFYLSHGTKPSAKQRKAMREMRAVLDVTLEEDEE